MKWNIIISTLICLEIVTAADSTFSSVKFASQLPLPSLCATGNIYTEKQCPNDGSQQAPINVDTTTVIKTAYPSQLTFHNFELEPVSGKFENIGGNVGVYFNYPENVLTPNITGGPLGEKVFNFKKLRIKFGLTNDAGTEHSINGKKYALETQLEFVSAAEEIAIVTSLFEANATGIGVSTSLYDQIKYPGSKFTAFQFPITLAKVISPDGWPYAYYKASDTEPPCKPNVYWFVGINPQPIDITNVEAYRKVMGDNNVPAAPNFRQIQGTSENGITIGLTRKGD